MDKEEFFSYKILSRFASIIEYAFSDEYKLIILEKDAFKNTDFNLFLKFILNQLPRKNNFIKMRCILQTMISFGSDIENDIGYDLAFLDYQNLNSKLTQSINSHINEDEFDDKVAHNICVSLLNLCYTKPGIFFTILPYFEKILKNVNLERANKVAGPESLLFYSNPDIESFNQLKIDPMMILLFFQYPVIFTDLPFCKAMQTKFSKEYEYPKELPTCDVDMSFLNTTLELDCHFLDTISNSFVKFIEDSDNYKKIPNSINKYPRILPLLILAHQPLLYKDLNKSLALFKHEFISSLSSEIIKRFQNDHEIINVISFMTSNEITSNDLLEHSLPYLLQFSLNNSQLVNYSEMKFYLINDEDAQTDFDFIRCYQILRTFLSFFQKPTNTLEQNFQKMQTLISSISNKATQSFLLFDLFSLIFVQKNDRYVCHQFVAEKHVQMLLQFMDSPYFRGAEAVFNSRRYKPKKKDPPNLQIYFEKNNNSVYPAIREQNWALANQLTEFNPYLRKLYTRAYSISLIINNQPIPPNMEKEWRHALFDYSLSTFSQEVLKKDFLHFSTFAEFVKTRLKYKSVQELMACLPDNKRYNDAIKSAAEIGDKIAESIADGSIKNYVQSFSVSENLLEFLNDVDLYFNCVKMNPKVSKKSIKELFSFDLKKAFAGPFNKGDYQKAEDLAHRGKIDLFQFIIQNLSCFIIKEKYLTKSINKYFLECVCLALQMKNYNFLNQQNNISKSIQKFIKQQNESTDDKSPLSKIIELIRHRKFDDIEDYLYIVDHLELYNYLIKTYQPAQFSDELIELLNVVQYIAPDSDKDKLKAIHLLNIIRHTTSETISNKIIDELMKKDMFQVAVDYIKVGIPMKSWGPPVIHLFSLCISNPERIDSMLVEFSSRFDLIESRFFHIHGIIPHLLKNCPPDKLDEVRALSLLPEEIMIDSNVFDFNTVAESFARQPKSILKLTPEMSSIFTDDNLLLVIEKVETTPYFNKLFGILYGMFKDKPRLIDIWTKKIFESIKSIHVDSITLEDHYIQHFYNQKQILMVFPDSDNRVQKINCIIEFLNYRPFLRCKLTYSFLDFGNNSFPPIFVNYLQQIDLFDLAQRVSDVFDVDISRFIIRRLNTLLLTHDLKGVSDIINSPTHKIEIDRIDPEGTNYDRSYFKLYPLTKMSIFDRQVFESIRNSDITLKDLNLPQLFVYQRIKVTKKIVLDKERNKIVPTFFRKAFSIKPCISLLVAHKYLNIAYQMLMHLGNQNESELPQAFISYFYKSALCSDYIQNTEQFLISQDPSLIITKSLWDNLVSFFQKHEMFNSLYKVYTIRNQPEEAAEVKLKIFNDEKSLPHKIALIGHAIYCLTNAIHYREHPEFQKEPKFVPNPSKNLDDIIKEKSLFEFMLKICEFCNDRQIPYINEYSLLDLRKDHTKLAVLLFLNGETQLLFELSKYIQISKDHIVQVSAKELSTKNFPDIVSSINTVFENDPAFGLEYLDLVLIQLSFISSYKMIIVLIMTFCKDPELQCKKMIEYDFLTEAYSVIATLKNKDLIPLAAHRASQLGQLDLLMNFQSLLKNDKK